MQAFRKLPRDFGITPWNPSPGLTVALAYLGGILYAPYALAATFTANLLMRPLRLPIALDLVGAALTGGVYMATGLVLRTANTFDPRLNSVHDVVCLIGMAISAAAVATMTFIPLLWGAELLSSDAILPTAWRSFVGDLIGILLIAPLAMIITARRPWPMPSVENMAQAIVLASSIIVVFGYRQATTIQLFYILFLPLLWISLRCGIVGSIVAINLVQIGLIVGWQLRFGSNAGLAGLQALMITLAITGLILGAVVTERQLAALRLRDQQDAMQRALRLRSSGEAAAAIAHEVSQPLTALATYAAVIEEALARNDLQLVKEAATKLREQSERAGAVVATVRNLLRNEQTEREPVDLGDIARATKRLLSDELAAKAISVTVDIPAARPLVFGHRMQLQQALHNLVSNSIDAIHAHAQSGEIRVSVAHADGDNVTIEVADSGPGFQPGPGSENATPFVSTKPDGSGLGLTIVRSIAEAHGGSLGIHSSSNGAVVKLRLPAFGDGNDRNHHHH